MHIDDQQTTSTVWAITQAFKGQSAPTARRLLQTYPTGNRKVSSQFLTVLITN